MFLGIFLMVLSAFLLTGCGNGSADAQADISDSENAGSENSASQDAESESPASFSHAKPQPAPKDANYVFPKTALFIDDTGKSTQRDGNRLYSYHKGRLIYFDTETEETVLLYRTASTHLLNFCIYKDDIYFVERTGFDSLDGKDTSLWRIGKDGGNLTLLQDDIENAYMVGNYSDYSANYGIDIYGDIIYLLCITYEYAGDSHYAVKTANLYYRIEHDGCVTKADESETLYGTLPRRFSPIVNSNFPTFPYAMRNYGYIFMQDEDKNLYRMNPENGVRENIDLDMDAAAFRFYGDLIFLNTYGHGALYNLAEKDFVSSELFPDMSLSAPYVYPSEKGLFLCDHVREDAPDADSANTRYVILLILPDGSVNTLFYGSLPVFENRLYEMQLNGNTSIFENHFYYYDSTDTTYNLMRFPIRENPDFQILETFSAFPASSPATLTAEESSEELDFGDYVSVSYSIRKLYPDGDTGSDALIKVALKRVYDDFEEYVKELMTNEQEYVEENPELYDDETAYLSRGDFSLHASCNYMDDDTISFCLSYYQYYGGAAHGYYWSDFYVFDRKTGKRLSFEDFAGNSAVILKTALPYVEQAAGWDFDSDMLLDESRFSLSEDGYTLYFAPYDIDCYAAGEFLITIPYEAFDKEL